MAADATKSAMVYFMFVEEASVVCVNEVVLDIVWYYVERVATVLCLKAKDLMESLQRLTCTEFYCYVFAEKFQKGNTRGRSSAFYNRQPLHHCCLLPVPSTWIFKYEAVTL